MIDKIIDFIKEVSNDKELNNPYCVISIFDSHVNFCIYICNKVKNNYLCGGHLSFCTLEESKSKTLFDLYELSLQLNKLGIKLVVDFNWFIDSK